MNQQELNKFYCPICKKVLLCEVEAEYKGIIIKCRMCGNRIKVNKQTEN